MFKLYLTLLGYFRILWYPVIYKYGPYVRRVIYTYMLTEYVNHKIKPPYIPLYISYKDITTEIIKLDIGTIDVRHVNKLVYLFWYYTVWIWLDDEATGNIIDIEPFKPYDSYDEAIGTIILNYHPPVKYGDNYMIHNITKQDIDIYKSLLLQYASMSTGKFNYITVKTTRYAKPSLVPNRYITIITDKANTANTAINIQKIKV